MWINFSFLSFFLFTSFLNVFITGCESVLITTFRFNLFRSSLSLFIFSISFSFENLTFKSSLLSFFFFISLLIVFITGCESFLITTFRFKLFRSSLSLFIFSRSFSFVNLSFKSSFLSFFLFISLLNVSITGCESFLNTTFRFSLFRSSLSLFIFSRSFSLFS